jgi:hypothetical protein
MPRPGEALLRAKAESDAAQAQRISAEIDQAIAWLQSKWGGEDGADAVACPYCGHNSWNVGPPLELVTRRSAMAPMFPVVCATCGHATFVSAVVAGLAEEPDQS